MTGLFENIIFLNTFKADFSLKNAYLKVNMKILMVECVEKSIGGLKVETKNILNKSANEEI